MKWTAFIIDQAVTVNQVFYECYLLPPCSLAFTHFFWDGHYGPLNENTLMGFHGVLWPLKPNTMPNKAHLLSTSVMTKNDN